MRLSLCFLCALIVLMPAFALAQKQGFEHYGDGARVPLEALNPAGRGQPEERDRMVAVQDQLTQAQKAAIKAEDFFQPELLTDGLGLDLTEPGNEPVKRVLYRTWATANEAIVRARLAYREKRPYQEDERIKDLASPPGTSTEDDSFPAPHAVMSYTLAGVLAAMNSDWRTPALQRAEAIAANRYAAGLHYEHDIKAGRDLAMMILGRLWGDKTFREDFNKAALAIIAAQRDEEDMDDVR